MEIAWSLAEYAVDLGGLGSDLPRLVVDSAGIFALSPVRLFWVGVGSRFFAGLQLL